ncbi:MAG: hypothetical protein ACN4GM_08725 [Gammaproteobacteria bacterium]
MIMYAIIILAITAIGGLLMATKVLSGKQAPWFLSIVHALLGATGLVLLTMAAVNADWPGRLSASLALLIIAALGGFYLASHHFRGSVSPKGIVLIHAGVAVTGFLSLLTVFFKI